MEIKEINSEEENNDKEFSVLNEDFLEETDTGRYEIFGEDEMYKVHRSIDENKCSAGTAKTHMVAHLKCDKLSKTFWVSLCQNHYQRVKHNDEIDILSDTRRPY